MKTALALWTLAILAILVTGLGLLKVSGVRPPRIEAPPLHRATKQTMPHVVDRAGILPAPDARNFEQYMKSIMRESGVDVRFVFLPDVGDTRIETVASELMDQLKVGGRTGRERGLLLLYDMGGKRLKIEVGYGLEEWFPDSFIRYLVEEHARTFFESGDLSVGLGLMLRILQNRIREAVLGNAYDPRLLTRIHPLNHLSGGAGVATSAAIGGGAPGSPAARRVHPLTFPAKSTPRQTYNTYIDWLSRWSLDTQADLFTPGSRSYLASLHISRGYAEYILFSEYGKSFAIVQRDSLALLYFTGTPFCSPHFFVRDGGLWRMDLEAEVRDTREFAGGEYSWCYIGRDDEYSRVFADLLTTIRRCQRFREGDNRPLVIRGSE